MPQPAGCAAPDSKPLRGALLATGGDDCPAQAEKLPNRPATVTNTARGYPRAKPLQGAGIRALSLIRPRVCPNTKKKLYTDNLVLKKAFGTDNQSL